MLLRTALKVLLLGLLAINVACADEASIKKAFLEKFPKANVASVTKMNDFGLYEIVVTSSEPIIIYTDEKFSFMMQGSLIETKKLVDLTEQRKNKLMAIDFDSLPLDRAIKKVKGNGSRKVAVFSDPDCPFCKRVEQELEKMNDVTVYILLFPIEALHPNAPARSKQIWCSADRLKAWDDYMLRGTAPQAKGDCENPIDMLVDFGKKKGINATPTLVFEDGSRVPGALNVSQLEAQFSSMKGN